MHCNVYLFVCTSLKLSTPTRSGLTENMDRDSGKSLAATKLLPEVEGGGVLSVTPSSCY